jgi:hypothetical protein
MGKGAGSKIAGRSRGEGESRRGGEACKEESDIKSTGDADTQEQANREEGVREEEQTARARARAEGRAEARRSNTKGLPSSVIEKRVVERAKLEDRLRNVVTFEVFSLFDGSSRGSGRQRGAVEGRRQR